METEKLSPQAYADKVGTSRQAVTQLMRRWYKKGKEPILPGVVKIETMEMGNGRKSYILEYNSDHKP